MQSIKEKKMPLDKIPIYIELIENKEKLRESQLGKEFVVKPMTSSYKNSAAIVTTRKSSNNVRIVSASKITNNELKNNDLNFDLETSIVHRKEESPLLDIFDSLQTKSLVDKHVEKGADFLPTESPKKIENVNHRQKKITDLDEEVSNIEMENSPLKNYRVNCHIIPQVPPLREMMSEKSYNDLFKEQTTTNTNTTTHSRKQETSDDATRHSIQNSKTYAFNKQHSNKHNAEQFLKKQELLAKFKILKKYDNAIHIPEYDINFDYAVMKKHYKLIIKQIHVQNKVTTYKTWLLGICTCIEFFLGEACLGLNMEGYTKFQADNMEKYEKLLIKIGEKSYAPTSISKFPVEMQLMITIIIQTMLFLMTQFIKSKTGISDVLNNISSKGGGFMGKNSEPQTSRLNFPNI
jgi:hypothetical protein